MKFSRDNLLRPESALALFLLAYALLAGLFYKHAPVDSAQYINWHLDYSLGYINRALMGSIFQFFYGGPDRQVISQVIPRWDYNLLRALIILTWTLLAAPILFIRAGRRQKLFLLAAAAVLLLAPVWRTNAVNIGFMDKWVFLASLGAIAAIVLKRPFVYLIFCLLGILIHPQMIFYIMLLTMLILHAVYFIKAYQTKYRQWLAAATAAPALSLLAYLLSDAQLYIDILAANNYQMGKTEAWIWNSPEKRLEVEQSGMLIRMRNAVLGLLIFGGIPVLFAVTTAFVLYKSRMMEFRSRMTKKLGRRIPLEAAEKYQLFILLLAPTVVFIPSHLASGDWSRHFYWAWWGIALVMIYLIWNMPQSGAQPDSPKKRTKNRRDNAKNKAAPAPVIALFFVWAYLYGGAPLNVSHVHAPWIFSCQQFCIPGLTVHRPGEIYANAIFTTLKDALLPFHQNADMIRVRDEVHHSPLIKYEDDKLIVPAESDGHIAYFIFLADGNKPLVFTANYEAADAPDLYLSFHGQRLQPSTITNARATWRFVLPFGNSGYGLARFDLINGGGVSFALAGVSIDSE